MLLSNSKNINLINCQENSLLIFIFCVAMQIAVSSSGDISDLAPIFVFSFSLWKRTCFRIQQHVVIIVSDKQSPCCPLLFLC